MARAQKIFAKRALKFGPLIGTNDPKETKDWRFTLVSDNADDLLQHRGNTLSSNFSSALKARTKVACFSADFAPLSGDHTQDFHRRGFSKSRMWTQYAGNHGGVCVVFDKDKLRRQISAQISQGEELLGGLVRYVNRYFVPSLEEGDYQIDLRLLRKMGFDRYVARHRKTFSQRLFFEKMSDWRDENEFRWIVFSETENDLYVRYADSLVGVVFGDSVTDSDVDEALRNLPLNVEVMGLKWKNCSAWYDFGALRYGREFRAENGLYADKTAG